MARTPTFARNRAERGAALLEASIALALVAIVAGAGLSAFGAANEASRAAELKLANLAKVENALETASAAGFLRDALEAGGATLEGEGWRATASVYADAGDESGEDAEPSPLALIRLVAEAGDVRLETIRSLPR